MALALVLREGLRGLYFLLVVVLAKFLLFTLVIVITVLLRL